MNKTYQTLLVLLILTSLNVLLTFNNGYARLIIKFKTGLIVKLKTDIDTQIIRIGGLSPEKVIITAETREQNLQFTWNIDGPGKLLETATNQNVYIPPDKIDETADQTIITVTATDDKGNQGGDELTFTLISFSTQERLIRLEVKVYTEKYEALIKQEQQGVNVNDQIIPILEEIIEGLKETKEIYGKFSQTHPEISQELNQIQDTIKRFEKELFDRSSELIADFNAGKDPINSGGKLWQWNYGENLLKVETGYYELKDDDKKYGKYAAFVALTEPKKVSAGEWAGGGLVVVFQSDESAIDVSDYQFLEFDVKIRPGSTLENTRVKLESPGRGIYIERVLSEYGITFSTEWQAARIPLEHFATRRTSDPDFVKETDLTAVRNFVTVSVLHDQAQNTQGTLLIDNIRFTK